MPATDAKAVGEPQQLLDLVARITDRDQAALGQLYDLTVARAFAIAVRVLGNPADAEEAVCAAYQQVWEQSAQYLPGRGSVMGWLSTMVWTRAVDLLRRRRSHVSLDDLHPGPSSDAYMRCEDESAALIDASLAGTAVRRALSALRPVSRTVIELAFVKGLSHPEIATRTRLPLGTVKSHIRRGLVELRRLLGSEDLGDV
jgi:RNA polymerase sigma-70 factor (ECF subfamily)